MRSRRTSAAGTTPPCLSSVREAGTTGKRLREGQTSGGRKISDRCPESGVVPAAATDHCETSGGRGMETNAAPNSTGQQMQQSVSGAGEFSPLSAPSFSNAGRAPGRSLSDACGEWPQQASAVAPGTAIARNVTERSSATAFLRVFASRIMATDYNGWSVRLPHQLSIARCATSSHGEHMCMKNSLRAG